MAISPDGTVVAICGGPWPNPLTMHLFRRTGGRFDRRGLVEIPNGKPAIAVAFSNDSSSVAVSDFDGYVRIWDLESNDWRAVYHSERGCHAVAYSPDDRLLAIGSHDKIVFCSVATGDIPGRIPTPTSVTSLQFAPDGKTLAWGGGQRRVEFLKTAPVEGPAPIVSAAR